MSTPDVYLITAIHADGSRRQWTGKWMSHESHKTLYSTKRSTQEIINAYEHFDPHVKLVDHYVLHPLDTLPDCPTKNKTLIQ
ncbi:MAG: hypothetical protein ACRCWJ_18165 [Casimicrobium sp.]